MEGEEKQAVEKGEAGEVEEEGQRRGGIQKVDVMLEEVRDK